MSVNGKKKTICLNMIVKNEAHIIADTLEHLDKYIKFDYWVISDTGSTDKTKEIIKEFFKKKNIPGKLVEHEWKDFGFNRSAACAAAYNKSDYIFVWDADDEISGDFVMPSDLTADSYKFIFGNDSGFRYSRGQLFNNHQRWIYKGVLHEYADCLDPTGPMESILGNYYFISGRKGDRSKDPNKYLKDALVLEKGFAEAIENKDHLSNRYAFYCAQSYASCNMHEKAIEWYKKSLTLNLWVQERYISCLEIYEQYEHLKKADEGLRYLVESYKYDTTRVECIYRIIKHYCIHGPPEVAYMYYTLIQDFYENKYLTGKEDISDKLFAKKDDHDFYLPYYMVIVAERVKQLDVCGKMYDMIATQQYLHAGEWWIRNLVHNIQFCINNLPKNIEFLQRFLDYIDKLIKRGVTLEPNHYAVLGKVIDTYRPLLTMESPLAKTLATESRKNPTQGIQVMVTLTTCKRFDLFEKTMNSILNTWTDIDKVDYFLCVDDNSTQRDRSKMAKTYPFFNFYMKTSKEKGHRKSMNIIYDKLQEYKPKYWIHLEDDWLFFQKGSYVEKSIKFLEKYESRNIHQILFNRNYTEVYDQWTTNGGEPLEPGFTVHLKSDNIPGRNCGYWPHYSFRPSMVRVETIFELGNYDSPNTFFERDYADRYFAKGYKSGFYDTICSLHIGKLTSDKTGTNAYTLNNAGQFGEAKKPNKFIVNLVRRTDRKEEMEELFEKHEITGYEFYEAVDGQQLTVSEDITKMFLGNDFGSRKGFIGCALSHYDIWKQLLEDTTNEHYTIFEDDIKLVDGFKDKYESALTNLDDTKYDILFLGFTQHDKNARFAASEKSCIPLEIGKYIGGFFGYVITKQGAKKLDTYIQENGIKHGIDYLIKLIPGFTVANIQPHIVVTEWVSSFSSPVDTDIQKDYTSLPLINPKINKDDWIFYEGFDSGGEDIQSVGHKAVDELFAIAGANPKCVAFNTLGFMKSQVSTPFITSQWLQAPNGLYVRKSYTSIQKPEQPVVDYRHDGWVLYEGLDSLGDDLESSITRDLGALVKEAEEREGCIAFNTNGFLKSAVTYPLIRDKFMYGRGTGIYIRKEYVNRIRVKMLCNWCSSEDLCKEWLKLSKGNYMWNDIQITWEDSKIDYYVIINKPRAGDIFIPERTIIFHMEPWCSEPWQTWGVKTWGEWAKPDLTKFLQVRSHDMFCNTGFWQLSLTYTELKEKVITKSETLGNIISSICSSKYFDPGHKKRIDFMKFIEAKGDPSVKLHIYNEDNQHNFASYVGKARPFVDKEKGIVPYKYYFMCENNVETNFITEKLWEPILCESLCFYWGCPNVSEHIDPLAYVQLDMEDFEGSFQIVKNAIESNLWEQRLPAIKKAKERVLEYSGFFPTLERVIKGTENSILTGASLLKKNVCFIHSCTLASTGTEKLDLLLDSIQSSGLLNELDSIIINNIGIALNSAKYKQIDSRIEVIQHSINTHLFEIPTLKLIHEYSTQHPNVKILYLHTKGISYAKTDYRYQSGLDWIHYMLYFLVGASHYKKCLRLLDTYDTVGCNYDDKMPHYSGNFWWAKSSYLKTLSLESLTHKMSAEWWLLSPKPLLANKYVLHTTNKNHFSQLCKLEEYCKKSLVVYTYFSSPSSDYNLNYYCKYAMKESVEVDYILIINGNTCEVNLPELYNLKIIRRDNIGFDFGGHKAALDSLGDKKYDYYFFMNSGMMGPFLPDTLVAKQNHWVHQFIPMITDKVKLVGTSIFCESEANHGSGPRVESFFFMTDAIGLELLLKKGTVFYNHSTKYDAVKDGELGMSECILQNGYTVDCMLEKYRGLDWSDKANYTINNNQYPSRNNSYFGKSINPFEVIFHKWFWTNPADSDVSLDIVQAHVKTLTINAIKSKNANFEMIKHIEMGPFAEFEMNLKTLSSLKDTKRPVSFTHYIGAPIIFQTEQMSYNNGSHRNADSLLKSIPVNKKVLILDYSLTNIKHIKDAIDSNPNDYSGIKFVHTPLLYNLSMLSLYTLHDTKENDIGCIFGCESDRRMAIVSQLREKGLKVFVINNWDIQGKIYELSKCRVLLNIHYTDKHSIFEYARCTTPLLLGIPILSEESNTTDDLENMYLKELLSTVQFESYENLVEKAIQMVQKPETIKKPNLKRLKALSDIEYESINSEINGIMATIEKVDKHVCFIHSCNIQNTGTEILDSLLESIKTSGLINVLDTIVINNVGVPLDGKYLNFHSNVRVIQHSTNTDEYELPTLKLIHNYSLQQPGVKVLYLHTKGVSYRKVDFIYSKNTDWVNYMLYFLVNRYNSCIRLLDIYDTAGCDYTTLRGNPHYAGNFWWATTDYLSTLSVDTLKVKHDAEWWILTGKLNNCVLHTSNFDWYSEGNYKLESYIQDSSTELIASNDITNTVDTVLCKHMAFVSLVDDVKGGGLCNQVMALIDGITDAIKQNKKIVVVNDFNPQISSSKLLAARDVFNLNEMNQLLLKYNIKLIDRYQLTYSILSVHYGTDDSRIDVTKEIFNTFVFDTILYIPKSTNLNKLKGDPFPGKVKKLFLKYSIAGNVYEDGFDEVGGLQSDICINVSKLPFKFQFHWINANNQSTYEEFTKYIRFNSTYTKLADSFRSNVQHTIHIRNEDDGLTHWSRQNSMAKDRFKRALELKYMNLIEKYIPKDEHLTVLTYDTDSSIIKFLNSNNYKFSCTNKELEGREQNAIVDLLIGSKTPGTFIGNFNTHLIRGSSFTYTILQLLDSNTKKVLVDLDDISNDVIVC